MSNKIVKVFLVCQFAFALHCLAQDKENSASNNLLLRYNNFLKSVRLDTLLQASSFSIPNKDTTRIETLTLKPNPVINSPFEFAEKWNRAKSAAKQDIYRLLFTRLAAYSAASPDSLAIRFNFDSSGLFAFRIYFDKGIQVNGQFIDGRDAIPLAGPGELDDIAYGGVLTNIPQSADLDRQLATRLKSIFKTYKHRDAVEVQSKNWGPGILGFRISNVHGEVTPNLYEVITINMFVQPAGSKQVTVSFLYTVLCAGGMIEPPTDTDAYKDAINSYKKEVTAFGIRFKQQLKTSLNAL